MEVTPFIHVFIVDDSAFIRVRLAELLGTVENVVVVGEANCARDAIAGILGTHPEAVLLDLTLVEGTGLEVIRTVVPQSPQIVFVVLTNHSEPQYRDACFQAGARYFLDKSRDMDKVCGVIGEIAKHREKMQ